MARVSAHSDEKGGHWLTVTEDEEPIVGAYVEPYMGGDPKLTIFWKGRVEAGAFVDFCRRVTEDTSPQDGVAKLEGWAYAAGKAQEFFGSEWLNAAEVGSPRFLRFERRMIKPTHLPEFILWGRHVDYSNADDDEDENIGVQLRKGQVSSLSMQIVDLITATQLDDRNGAAVHRALLTLSDYLI